MVALSTTALTWLAVVGLASVPFLVAIAIDPVTRRMAFRNPVRRPAETALVVLGSLLGTAIITGSLIVGDTIDRSIRARAYDQLGPIDEIVTAVGFDDGAALVARIGSAGDVDPSGEVIDGVLPMVTTQVSVVGDRVQPRAQLVEVDFVEAAAFGDDPAITGITGATPASGTAVITDDLALATGAGPGDDLTVNVYGVPVTVTVDRVFERTGVAGYWQVDDRQQAYNVFVTPGSLAAGLSGHSLPPEVEPPRQVVAFSNVGGVEDSASLTDEATVLIEAAVGPRVAVQPVKDELLATADAVGDSLSQLYLTMGMFSVAAGVLLLVNIFVMLADERRSQLGMLRAIGMRRRALVVGYATEGWIYSVVSAVIGALIGIQLGRLISWRADQILDVDDDRYALSLTFSYDRDTVVQGFAIGLLIALATTVLTSVRISRLNVIAAIRDLPVPATAAHRRWGRRLGWTALLLGVVITVAASSGREPYGLAVGPMLIAAGTGALLYSPMRRRSVVTVTTLVIIAWGALVIPVLAWLDINADVPIFLVQGLTMCAAGVALLMVHHKALGVWLSERTGGSLPIRIGLAYPVAKGFRTAMTLGMFGIVVLTIVYLSFISLMVTQQVDDLTDDLSGGYGVVVNSNPSDPVNEDELTALDEVDEVAPLVYTFGEITFADRSATWPVTGFGSELAAAPPALSDRGDYADDPSAWQAVLTDPALVIADEFLLNTGGPQTTIPAVGDALVVADPLTGASREVTIAALATPDYLISGVFYGIEGTESLFGERAVTSRFYVAPALGTTDTAAALAIASTFAVDGAEATAVRDTVEAMMSQTTGFFTLMQQFVGVGLLIGIAGLGVVLVRAVRERRRDVGVMRAIGMGRRPVVRSFLFEAMFVATEGVLLGIGIALVGTYGLVLNGTGFMEGFTWAVPWASIATVAAITLGAAALTAMIPSRAAGKTEPARALRIVD